MSEEKNSQAVDSGKKEESLEKLFARLDETVHRMQDDNVTMEESFRLYESGMKDIAACSRQLDQIEKKMMKLTSSGALEPLDPDDA